LANTNVEKVMPKIIAQGVAAIREFIRMPILVNRSYSMAPGRKGSTVDVPVSSAVPVNDVAPAITPPANVDTTFDTVQVKVDKWKEAPFYLTDKDYGEIQDGVMNGQVREAIRALANQVDKDLLDLYKDIYGVSGTAGTTPFGAAPANLDVTDAANLGKVLYDQFCPEDPRHAVINSAAQAKAIAQRPFQDLSWTGDAGTIIKGRLNERMGFKWWMDSFVKTHTAGTLTGTIVTTTGPFAVGVKSVTLDSGAAEAVALVKGDIITFAGDAQTYVVTADLTVGASATGAVLIEPGLKVAITTAVAVAVKATHVANLGFHPEAFAFATKPLETPIDGRGFFMQAVDEMSSIVLRLEVTRQHRQTKWAFDILYGVKTVRREYAARLLG